MEHEPLQLPSKNRPNFVEFEVRVEGKAITPQVEMRAFHDGCEITERLRAAGLPVSVIDDGFAAAVRKLSDAQRREFEKHELVVSDEPGPNRRVWPNWKTRTQFY